MLDLDKPHNGVVLHCYNSNGYWEVLCLQTYVMFSKISGS